MERPTVLIISDEPEFANAICIRWQAERNSPQFVMDDAQAGIPNLIILGPDQEVKPPRGSDAPVIHVTRARTKVPGIIEIPAVDGWPELVITVAKQVVERQKLASEITRLSESRAQLQRDASLGRYILEMRHSLNNALTSILGNSELMLTDSQSIPPSARLQIETIRNMGMRMNEILQRFTSLQKEMQIAEPKSSKGLSKAASAARI